MYIPQITFTRFMAALTIVIFHFGVDVSPFNEPSIRNLFAVYRDASYFFFLSGFVMVLAYGTGTKTIEKKRYLMVRILRLYPLYLIGLILILIRDVVHGVHSISDYGTSVVVNLFLLQAWFPGFGVSLNPPAWAISVQVFFYLLFPSLLTFLKKMSASAQITITILFWLLTQALYVSLMQVKRQPGNINLDWFLRYSPLIQLNCFMFGVTGALMFGKIHKKISPGQSLACLLGSFIAIGLIVLFMPDPSKRLLRNGMLCPLFLLFLVALSTDRTVISRVISRKPFLILGELSFPLFVLQAPVHSYSAFIFDRMHMPPDGPLRFYVYLALLMTASYIWFRFFQKPLSAKAKGLLHGGLSRFPGG
jgi:peptidoglycan/LPS O-acetylase OafA/YrhL